MSAIINFFEYIWGSRVGFFVMGALSMLTLISLGVSIGITTGDTLQWVADFSRNFGAEMVGVALTFGLLGIADRAKSTNDFKSRLVRNVRSTTTGEAMQAIEDLRERGWLTGDRGVLKGAQLRFGNLAGLDLRLVNMENAELLSATLAGTDLSGANLQRAFLNKVNLQNANLFGANLKWANLWNADMSDARLLNADLQGAEMLDVNLADANLFDARLDGANLEGANLQGANLAAANLKGASLNRANLSGANMRYANLARVNLEFATLTNAKLPDGTVWTEDTDMMRFTNEKHIAYDMTREKVNELRAEAGLNYI